MANANKKKGTRAESKVVKYLDSHGFVAKRMALKGANDPGDIEAYAPDSTTKIILEVKTGKQTAAPNRTQIEEWCRQAEVEGKNSDADIAVLVVVRQYRALEDADVYEPLHGTKSRIHWYLSDWVESLKR